MLSAFCQFWVLAFLVSIAFRQRLGVTLCFKKPQPLLLCVARAQAVSGRGGVWMLWCDNRHQPEPGALPGPPAFPLLDHKEGP